MQSFIKPLNRDLFQFLAKAFFLDRLTQQKTYKQEDASLMLCNVHCKILIVPFKKAVYFRIYDMKKNVLLKSWRKKKIWNNFSERLNQAVWATRSFQVTLVFAAFALAMSLHAMITRAPRLDNSRAFSKPIPVLHPVMTTVFLWSFTSLRTKPLTILVFTEIKKSKF